MTVDNSPIIIWFRRDLRLADNPALHAAVQTGRQIILLYILETNLPRNDGGAKNVWLYHSLLSLSENIKSRGGDLTLRRGSAKNILDELIKETGATAVYWNRRYTENGRNIDEVIKSDLKTRKLDVQSFNANLLTEPWAIESKTGGFYKVFTPYWRAVRAKLDVADALPAPDELINYPVSSLALDALNLTPKNFERGTSRLSAHLAHGEISPRQIWHAAQASGKAVDKFLSEIGWREFSYVLMYHFPKLASENFKPAFDAFEWDIDEQALERWQRGQTGYPFVDAGMRELWQTGWQHNRVRMVCASFLIKHLLQDWRAGEAWYWDTLLEADPASNAASWQWVAGSGADASPYFRIFNPFSQGEKFDSDGDYVRKYVPELAKMPKKYIHRPWEAPDNILEYAGVKLGLTYPNPIVDHKCS